MADRTVPVVPPRAVWRRFQPGSWQATWLHAWELRDGSWWGVVDFEENGHAAQRIAIAASELRPRDPDCGALLLSRISGEPPGPVNAKKRPTTRR